MHSALLFSKLEQKKRHNFKFDVASILQERALQFQHKVALTNHPYNHDDDGCDECFTYAELANKTCLFSVFLTLQGVKSGDRIIILCESRPLWAPVFFAILSLGAIAVPLDPQLSEVEIKLVIKDARPNAIISSEKLLPQLKQAAPLKQSDSRTHKNVPIFSLENELNEAGDDLLKSLSSMSIHRVHFEDVATICYTSGTTGKFKGVEVTYQNLLCQVEQLNRAMQTDGKEVCVSILPLHHLFELSVGFLSVLWGGGRICYLDTLQPEHLLKVMQQQSATFLLVVPVFLSLLKRSIELKVSELPWLKRSLFSVLIKGESLFPKTVKKRLFAKIHQQFGENFKYFVCGGAPLHQDTLQFYKALGLDIYQGYGMSETSPVITANTISDNKNGSVGKPLPGVEVAIINQHDNEKNAPGEIVTRGHHVMRGYFHDEQNTRQSIDNKGWLHTGDLGYLDDEGYLYVTGRSKNTIVLEDGQNVQPEQIEPFLLNHKCIKEGCVIATRAQEGINKGRLQVCLVVVPEDRLQIKYQRYLYRLEEKITLIVTELAKQLPRWKRPAQVIVLCQDLPRSTTRKIKRNQVERLVASHQSHS